MDFGLLDLDQDAGHVAAAEGVDADGRPRGTVAGDGRCLLMALFLRSDRPKTHVWLRCYIPPAGQAGRMPVDDPTRKWSVHRTINDDSSLVDGQTRRSRTALRTASCRFPAFIATSTT